MEQIYEKSITLPFRLLIRIHESMDFWKKGNGEQRVFELFRNNRGIKKSEIKHGTPQGMLHAFSCLKGNGYQIAADQSLSAGLKAGDDFMNLCGISGDILTAAFCQKTSKAADINAVFQPGCQIIKIDSSAC